MKTVGLVTSWRENYGSVLQCYATKMTVQKLGYYCEVLYEQNKGIEKYKHYLKRACFLCCRVLCYKGFFSSYKRMKVNGKNAGMKISKESLRKLEFFAHTVLQPRGCDYKLLEQFAELDEYVGFIAGSDQIWNSQEPANPVCFLSFAPSSKKIALAPSFGANDIANFNREDFKKLISDFSYLSVREESGEALIESLIGKKVTRLADPSVLLSAKEWRFFAKEGKNLDKPYILLHFLDEPNDKALEVINAFQGKTGYQVVILAYPHQKFETIDKTIFIDASPYDFVSLIDNASIVCTDSFHTSLFSISLNSQFYTFERQYKRVVSQSSRIETLLKLYDYEERMIANDDSRTVVELLNLALHDCSCLLETERRKTLNYLINALNKKSDTNKVTPNKLKDSIDCVGCGACVAICQRGALSFSLDNRYGYSIPMLDNTKCVKCGMCEKVCYSEDKQISFSYDKEAYIAYNLDARLRHDSASGGVFSALAKHIIKNRGVVFGAVIDFDTLPVTVHHAKAETLEELKPLLNSKYVQSNCSTIYPEVKLMLETGRIVLFSGTSCQVNALYKYISGKQYPNLFTVDLICHGVPGERLFQEYVEYLENKYHGKIRALDFRTKDTVDSFYIINITLSKNGTDENIEIPLKKSAYYRMFMAGDNYRESCYKCKFSSINKPGDITVGDYYEAEADYPELFDGRVDSLNLKDGLSCLLVNSIQGYKLLVDAELTIWKYPVDVETVQKSHLQLCQPQTYSIDRKRYFNLYEKKGYLGIERFLKRRDLLNFLPQKIISILRFLNK